MEALRFSTALRDEVRRRMEHIGETDLLIGIPSYNTQGTIAHVMEMAAEGLYRYYPRLHSLIFVSDGGSVDDTREVARSVDISTYQVEKIVTIYRGYPGKGSAVRAIFEAAKYLRARAVVLLDSDLRSIRPEWIPNLVEPVIEEGFDFVAPYYLRYKYDGTITNTIAYNLVRSLYGKRVRQPIGGDFAFSRPLVRAYLEEEVWETDVARFGIDVWLTINAIVKGFRIIQAQLGVKIHNVKDPAEHLGPMFRQVVGTLFTTMEHYEKTWKSINGSEEVPIRSMYPIEGRVEPFHIDVDALIEYFRLGFQNFGPVWERITTPDNFRVLKTLASRRTRRKAFLLPEDVWARIVYDFAVYYHRTPRQRVKLVDLMLPLYHARVASLVQELESVPDEEVEAYYEQQAEVFEREKAYLIQRWEQHEETREEP